MKRRFSFLLQWVLWTSLILFFVFESRRFNNRVAFDDDEPSLSNVRPPKNANTKYTKSKYNPAKISKPKGASSHTNDRVNRGDVISASQKVFSSSPDLEPASLPKPLNSSMMSNVPNYLKSILDPEDETFSRLECDVPDRDRYRYLQDNPTKLPDPESPARYFFALDLHQNAHVLPRLLGSVLEAVRFLGPEYCELSIVEGRSTDGTYEILASLHPELESLGLKYYLAANDTDPHDPSHSYDQRIEILASLRNQVLSPLVSNPSHYTTDTTIIFLNDVSLCADDILELIHQRSAQSAHMTCGMDYTTLARDPTFYDVWVARGMNGDSFFDIPDSGSWDKAWNLFWNDRVTARRLQTGTPFQVFSCWNGAATFTAEPFLRDQIHFRAPRDGECTQGEPSLFCKDMWFNGFSRIAVVPSVALEYSDEMAKKIKKSKGYVAKWSAVEGKRGVKSQIEWKTSPPEKVRCMPNYDIQRWVPWNETLGDEAQARENSGKELE